MSEVRRRRDKRGWFVLLGLFFAVFLFTFFKEGSKELNEEVTAASLANFDPGYIISDYTMGNYNAMTEAGIQAFLTAKGNCRDTRTYLADRYTSYSYHIKDGHFVCLAEETFGEGTAYGDDAPDGESAAHIIYRAAQDYRINPQVLIVLLQKEQSLITDSWPNNRQFKVATGYGCPDTAPCNSEYFGFRNQVRKAAAMFRTVLDGGWTNYPLGNNYIQYNPSASCGGSVVNIRSLATSALYRYTPYQPNASALAAGYGTGDSCGAYGNRNFYLYFEDWFSGITTSGSISEPRNLKAVQNGRSITISWDEPSDAALYDDIKYDVVLANNKGQEKKATVDGDKREYTFDELETGVYVAASVRANTKNSAKHSRITFDLSVGSKPSAPTDLAVERYNGGIRVSWKKADDGGLEIIRYDVVLADIDKKEFKMEVSGEKTETVFYGLALNEYFATSVRAVNAMGGNYSRITFSIKNYAEFSDTSEVYTGFSDMPTDEISKQAVSWAVYNGITDKNSQFNGETSLTRRQAMVLLQRFYSMFAK